MARNALRVQRDVAAAWYVMVTSASGKTAFATMGPYTTHAEARNAAEAARVVHYRIADGGGVRSPVRLTR